MSTTETIDQQFVSQEAWQGVNTFLDSYVGVRKGDTAIIVYVKEVRDAAKWLLAGMRDRQIETVTAVTKPFSDDGLEEQLRNVLPSVRGDGRVYLFVLEGQSLSHSSVHRKVLERYPDGMASMVWLHNAGEEFFRLGTAVGPEYLTQRNATLLRRLLPARRLRVTSSGGSDLEITLNPRYKWGSNRGVAQPGEPLVLPAGEISTYPESVNGTFVVDGAIHVNRVILDEVGRIRDTPIIIELQDSLATSFHCANPEIMERLEKWFASPNARRVGELGFGTNTGVSEFTTWNSRINERAPAVHLGFGQHDQLPELVEYWSDIHLDLIMADSQVAIEDQETIDMRTFANEDVQHPEGLPNEDGAAADADMPHQR